jgi:hypothetical protein
MSIGIIGYKTLKDFKAAIKSEEGLTLELDENYIETSMFGAELVPNKPVSFVGPDIYKKRTWYGTVTVDEKYKVTNVR